MPADTTSCPPHPSAISTAQPQRSPLALPPDSATPPPPQLQSIYQRCQLDVRAVVISCLPSPTTFSALVLSAMQSALPSSLAFGSQFATEPATPSCKAHTKSTAPDCGASTSAPTTTLSVPLGTNSVTMPTRHRPRPACPPTWPLCQSYHLGPLRDLPPGHHLTRLRAHCQHVPRTHGRCRINCEYYHTAASAPIKSTWFAAIKAGNYSSWPGLSYTLAAKYCPYPNATLKGHMAQSRQHMHSTQPHPASAC